MKNTREVAGARKKIDWTDIPDHVQEFFGVMGRKELREYVTDPSPYGSGTWERAATYRIRHALGVQFETDSGFSVINPNDNHESSRGTRISRPAVDEDSDVLQ